MDIKYQLVTSDNYREKSKIDQTKQSKTTS